ncbi:hypothetical protein H4R19_004626 [Coemansia spiralis]|nr:hypothetical protein H4R19_004626 [Coemansia spiralis]
MTQGTIARWEKKEGESFAAGDLLLQIETDKAQMDVEAQDNGVLVKILAPEGAQNVPVNSAIAVVAEEGDDLAAIDIAALVGPTSAPPVEATPAPPTPAAQQPPPPSASPHAGDKSARELLSPAVAYAIHSRHITNAGDIQGSGPRGRILKGDVIQFVKTGKAAVGQPAAPAVASKPAATAGAARPPPPLSADAETAFLVQALEPSVLRRLAAQDLARRTTTVQVPAEGLAKLAKSGGASAIDALAVRAAALALHQVPLGSGAGVAVAVDAGKAPALAVLPGAATAAIHELAVEIKSARAAGQAVATAMPAVVIAPEGLYTPATLPNAAVVVVGQPRAAVSAADAAAALDGALDVLTGRRQPARPAAASPKRPAQVIDVHVISASPAAAAFAARVRALLSNPELLGL